MAGEKIQEWEIPIEIVVNLELVSAAESSNILRDFSICVCQLLLNLFDEKSKIN